MPDRSDAQIEAGKAIDFVCRQGKGAVDVLPNALSQKAQAEITKYCSDIKAQTERRIGDVGVVVSGQGTVSQETLTELAELARKYGEKYSSSSPDSLAPAPLDPAGFTRGQGKQYELGVPFKFANGWDVKLLVNVNLDLPKQAIDFNGAGGALLYKQGNFSGEAKFFVDTSTANVGYGGFIGLKWEAW